VCGRGGQDANDFERRTVQVLLLFYQRTTRAESYCTGHAEVEAARRRESRSEKLEARTGISRKMVAPMGKAYLLYLSNYKVTLAAIYLRRVRVVGRSFAAALTHLLTVVTPPAPVAQKFGVALVVCCRYLTVVPMPLPATPRLCRRRRKTTRKISAEQGKYYRLYLHSGRASLAAIYLRRARVLGRGFAAALEHLLAVVTTPVPAASTLGVGFRRPCRGQPFSRRRTTRQM
jgi:hypothetical protein